MESTTNASVSRQAGLTDEELTLNDHILTSLLVLLASATDLVGKAIELMAEGMAALTHQIALHLLALGAQKISQGLKRMHTQLTSMKISHPQCVAGMAAHAPLSSTCSMSSAHQTLDITHHGVSSSLSDPPFIKLK